MRYYLIAGEASGDLHGSNLIKNLKDVDPEAEFRGVGGDLMQAAGANLSKHFTEMSFVGLVDVIKNLGTIKKALTFCKEDIASWQPDAVVLIDYPGFNLKIAQYAHEAGFKTIYYIAPKIWASRKHRIKVIRRTVDKLYVILPFEENYFRELGCDTHYVGNPLSDAIQAFNPVQEEDFRKENQLSDKPIIALLAGSRKYEIKNCLPEMIRASEDMKEYELVLAGAPSIPAEYYKKFVEGSRLKIVYNKTYDLLSHARAAMVTSGTATLETALFKVPEVVFYKVGTFTYLIGKPFFRLPFFSLVNIIMNREVVKEFLQFGLAEKIRGEITKLLADQKYRQVMLDNYKALAENIGKPGTSKRVARNMYEYLTS